MSPRLAAALLIALTLATWGAVPWGSFHFDDYQNLVLDDAVRGGAALRGRMVEGVRPLLRLSYALDYQMWGMTPGGFLATNLALHVAMVTAVWLLARRRLASEFGALIAGSVFALQPANAEVVSYVSGRSTGLMAALLLWGLVLHEMARDRHGPGRTLWRAASLGLFVAACLAKEVALIFPALIALWEWTRPDAREVPAGVPAIGEGTRKRLSADYQASRLRPTLLAATLLACLVGVVLLSIPRYRDLTAFSFALRYPLASLTVNARAVPVMLSLWVRPQALSVDHAFDVGGAPAEIAAGAVLIVGLAAAAVAMRRRSPVVTLAIGWVLLSLAPTNSLIAKLDPVTEKPLYLAWFGPALAFGAAFAAAAAKARTPVRLAAPGLVVVAALAFGGFESAARVRTWSNARALWRDAVAKAPDKSRCWNNLGMAYCEHKEDRAALAAFERAIALDPGNMFARRNRALLGFLAADSGEVRSPRRTHDRGRRSL